MLSLTVDGFGDGLNLQLAYLTKKVSIKGFIKLIFVQ